MRAPTPSIVACDPKCKRETIHSLKSLFLVDEQQVTAFLPFSTPFLPIQPTELSTARQICPTLHPYDIDLTRCTAPNSRDFVPARNGRRVQGRTGRRISRW